MISGIIGWLTDGANWSGSDGIPHRVLEHLGYSFAALLIATMIGLPLGLYVGHTGKGSVAVAGTANALRALPTFGLIIFVFVALASHLPARLTYLGPSLVVLVVLGVPAILSNTYAGVQNVDPAARDAAKGMGMTDLQVLWRVEVPNALPLILSGIRGAMLQIVATATIAAVVSLGGLGRFILDGRAQRDYQQMAGGAIIVALLAVVLDLLAALVQNRVVSRGITGRYASSSTADAGTAAGRQSAEVAPAG